MGSLVGSWWLTLQLSKFCFGTSGGYAEFALGLLKNASHRCCYQWPQKAHCQFTIGLRLVVILIHSSAIGFLHQLHFLVSTITVLHYSSCKQYLQYHINLVS